MKKLLFSLILSLLPIASSAIQYEYYNPLMKSNAAVKVNETVGVLTPPEGKGFGVLSALTNLQSVNSSIATNEYGIQVDTLGLVCPTEDAVAAAISAHNTDQSAHSYIQNRITVNDNAIAANADAIQKTRNDFIAADSEIHQILNSHAGELTTLRNDIDDLGDEVAVIEGKIPASTTSSNQLVNASQLAAEEQDIRDDMNQADSELQTQITAQAGAITTLRNDTDDLGDQVAGIEGKIPAAASSSNQLALNSQITTLQTNLTNGLALKLDKNQGSENANKILTVGTDGQITLSSSPGSGLLSVSHDATLTGAGTDASPLGIASTVLSEIADKADQTVVDVIAADYVSKTVGGTQTIASELQAPELTVATTEGTLNLSITAGVATIATNNGLDIISQTKFDTLPTTDDTTTWANALDANLVSKAQVASALSDLPTGANLPILMYVWADHLLNDISWLRADTFSWQSGDVYVAAYNHLASEMHIENLYAWQEEEKRNVYTKSATPAVGDSVYRESGVLYGTVQSVGADNITVNGNNFPRNSGGDILGTNAETDTVDGITITFYRAEDGHKICLPDQEDKILSLYNATGVAWYYILDTANKQFKLPRSKHNKYADTLGVVGNGKTLGLTDGVSTFGIAGSNNALNSAGAYIARSGNDTLLNVGEQIAGWTGATANGKTIGVTTDSTKSGIIAQQEQDTDQYKYLYFYVGNFERDAVEQTAGINTETFNNKADRNLMNTTDNVDMVIESQLPTVENGYTWYRKYKSGWVEQGGSFGEAYTAYTTKTITLPVEMADTKYSVCLTNATTGDSYAPVINSKTVTTFVAYRTTNYQGLGTWQVSGMSAQ